MRVKCQFSVPATMDEAWAAFNHFELVGSCFPGFTLTRVDGHEFAGTCKVKLGTVPLVYTGTGRYLERHLGGRHTVIEATGTDERSLDTASVKLRTSFSMAGDYTLVTVVTDVELTGPQAQLDVSVVADTADRLAAQFADTISARFADGLGAQALEADASSSYASDLGPAASTKPLSYTYNPPKVASQNDYEVIAARAPVWAARAVPYVLGGLFLRYVVRQLRRRPGR